MTTRPRILVARAVFPETLARLEQHFEVEHNQADAAWSRQDLLARLKDKAGALTTGTERIDAELLAACSELKICANMAVGFNNFEVITRYNRSVKYAMTVNDLAQAIAERVRKAQP